MSEAGGGQPEQSFELPPAEEGAEAPKSQVEKQRPATESALGKQAAPPVGQTPPVLPDVPTDTPAADVTDDTQKPVSSPKTAKLPAADGDLIEKQWVQKAKEIVTETKTDPYKQKNEMSKVKADYIQKRFKKSIKTDGAVAG